LLEDRHGEERTSPSEFILTSNKRPCFRNLGLWEMIVPIIAAAQDISTLYKAVEEKAENTIGSVTPYPTRIALD
jgi:hypothetical protein